LNLIPIRLWLKTSSRVLLSPTLLHCDKSATIF
jgi:hypothetical protein